MVKGLARQQVVCTISPGQTVLSGTEPGMKAGLLAAIAQCVQAKYNVYFTN